jgi:gas vesicle protein
MSKDSGNSFLAFVAGAAVGAVIGILYAPDKGKNTRDRLSYQLEKYREKLQQLIDELIEGKEEASSEAKVRNEQVTKDTIERAERLMSEMAALEATIKSAGK